MGRECSRDFRQILEGSLGGRKNRPKDWRAKRGRIEVNLTIRKTNRKRQDIEVAGRREKERLWPANWPNSQTII